MQTGLGFLKSKGLPPLPKSKVSKSKPSFGNHSFILESVQHKGNVAIGIPSCCEISKFENLPSLISKQSVADETGGRI